MSNDLLRTLVDTRTQIQKTRIAFSNRLSAIERGADRAEQPEQAKLEAVYARLVDLEALLDKDIAEEVKGIPIYERVSTVKGIGPMLAAKIIAMIDIAKCDTISSLWRFAGFGVVDGQREKLTKGEKAHYCRRLKTALYLIGSSFLKSNSPYRDIYDQAKEKYQQKHPDWTKLHIHHAAMGDMLKIFLSHLWETWRQMEGLPVTQPYILYPESGHSHKIDKKQFGW